MPHPSTAGQGLTPREDNSFIGKYHKSIGMEGYCNGLRGMGASLLPLRSVICMERSTAPPYGSWLEWRGQIREPNRSSSSCLPPLMFGGWKATGYLRVGDPLREFFLLQVFFEYAFHTERPEHKGREQYSSQRRHGLSAAPCSGSLLPPAWQRAHLGSWRKPRQTGVET